MRILLLLLVASACLVQTRANVLDSIKDKVGDVKEKITGRDEEKKEEQKKENEKSYRGGVLEQVGHAMVDAGVDRLAVEVQDKVNVPMGDTVTKLVASQAKKLIHEKINVMADKRKVEGSGEQQQQQQPPPPPPPAQPAVAQPQPQEPPKEEKHGLAGLMDKVQKVVSRRKRSTPAAQNTPKESGMSKIFSKIRSFGQKKDTAPDATKSKDSAKSKVEAETKVKDDETEAEKSDVEIDEEETDGVSVKSKAVNRRKRSTPDENKKGGVKKFFSSLMSFGRKKHATSATNAAGNTKLRVESETKPNVEELKPKVEHPMPRIEEAKESKVEFETKAKADEFKKEELEKAFDSRNDDSNKFDVQETTSKPFEELVHSHHDDDDDRELRERFGQMKQDDDDEDSRMSSARDHFHEQERVEPEELAKVHHRDHDDGDDNMQDREEAQEWAPARSSSELEHLDIADDESDEASHHRYESHHERELADEDKERERVHEHDDDHERHGYKIDDEDDEHDDDDDEGRSTKRRAARKHSKTSRDELDQLGESEKREDDDSEGEWQSVKKPARKHSKEAADEDDDDDEVAFGRRSNRFSVLSHKDDDERYD